MKSVTQTEALGPITLARTKILTEAYLERYFIESIDRASLLDPSFGNLWKSTEKLFHAGGKRIRPYVTLLGYQAYANHADVAAVIPAAAAQEILHLAMLIHDDIIDRDQIRYGIKNVSGQYYETYADVLQKDKDKRHFADSAAMLSGDLLLSDAYRLVSECLVEPSAILAAQGVLNEAVFTVIGGELLDTESSFIDRTLVRPLDIARFKTASYSFVSPLIMGARLAGAPDTEIEKLRDIGQTIGVAYQLQDDLLGMFGESEITGKSTTGDLIENKYTYLVQIFYATATSDQIQSYEAVAGKPDLDESTYASAKQLLADSGAKQAITDYIDELCSGLMTSIESLNISTSSKSAMVELLNLCVKREK